MEAIHEFLRRSKERKPKIALVGDMLIDQYYEVDANRVSPEFPVPIMKSASDVCKVAVPGGVGNVACQFRHFDIDVQLFAMIDSYARWVLMESRIGTANCHTIPDGHVPIKKRYYQGEFPLCRWDVEESDYGMSSIVASQEALEEKFSAAPKPEVVIFSDYQKGVFNGYPWGKQRWLKSMRDEDIITIVDSKNLNIGEWEGCTVFKPNSKEAELMTGIKDWERQCDLIQDSAKCMAVVITQGGNGVVGKVAGRYFEYRPRKSVVANSVIGAGDCFMAFLAMGLAHGMDVVDVAQVAFEAGAVYVQNMHNKPVTPYELMRHVDPVRAKLCMPPKERDYKLVFTNGCFDCGLTKGHVRYLDKAKQLGDRLIVAINGDESVRRLKGHDRPVMTLEDRMDVVAGLESVDFVVSFNEDTPYNLIKEIMPDLLVKGGDWKVEDIAGHDIVPVQIIGTIICDSTTQKIEKLRKTCNEDDI